MPTRADTVEKQGAQVVEADAPAWAKGPVPQVMGGLPPGVAPQIAFKEPGPPAEVFLAPTPRRDGLIRGYAVARVGRMPPYGGSPSSGPLIGSPLRLSVPVRPSYRKHVLEPGHQEPDPFGMLPHVETDPRTVGEVLLDGLDEIGQSAAALHAVPEPIRGGAGRHAPVASAASPAGAGGAHVAANLGVPVADSIRGSDRGLYVAGRASGARWDANGSVAPGAARGNRPCDAPGAAPRGRPLSPLQSVKRYGEQRAALAVKMETSGPEGMSKPQIQPAGGDISGATSKATSAAFKGLSKGQPPARQFVGMEGKQGDQEATKPDPEREGRMLALGAEIAGLAGRFGARRRRCRMDPIEVLRPKDGPVLWRREQLTQNASRSQTSPALARAASGTGLKSGGVGGPGDGAARARAQSAVWDDPCAVPQKYPARAGVAMKDTAAAGATQAAPPGAPGPSQADEGIPTGRQGPWGQEAFPRQDGAEARSRGESAPGAEGGNPGSPGATVRRPEADARGMGGPSTPVLLEVHRRLGREMSALLAARELAANLQATIESYAASADRAVENSHLAVKAAAIAVSLRHALRDTADPGSARERDVAVAALSHASDAAAGLMRQVEEQIKKADLGTLAANYTLAAAGRLAQQVSAALHELRISHAGLAPLAHTLGNWDLDTLARRAADARRRAERDMYRANRRALRHERNGVYMTRQYGKAIAASERANDMDRRALRYQHQAARDRSLTLGQRARAAARADYYESLAEHERHRAAVARSYAISHHLRGFQKFLKAQQARDERMLRLERQTIERNLPIQAKRLEFEAIRRTYGPRLNAVVGLLKKLAETGPSGFPTKDKHGNYIPKDPGDKKIVHALQVEEGHLFKKLKKLGKPTNTPDGYVWPIPKPLAPPSDAASGGSGLKPHGFEGTAIGHRIDYQRHLEAKAEKDPHVKVLLAQVRAEVKTLLRETIKSAAGRAEAAAEAGSVDSDRMHDPALTQAQRDDAARDLDAQIAVAAEAVAEIEHAIQSAPYDSAEELQEDLQRLYDAQAHLAELVAVKKDACKSRSCAALKCEERSNADWDCHLVPREVMPGPQDPTPDPTAGGTGESTSPYADPSAPGGGGAEAPGGTVESDGQDTDKGDAGDEEKKTVEPSEAGEKERRTVTTEPKPDEKKKKKKEEPKPPPGGGARGSLAGLFETIGGLVESFGRTVLGAAKQILNPPVFLKPQDPEPAAPPPRPPAQQPTQKDRIDAKLHAAGLDVIPFNYDRNVTEDENKNRLRQTVVSFFTTRQRQRGIEPPSDDVITGLVNKFTAWAISAAGRPDGPPHMDHFALTDTGWLFGDATIAEYIGDATTITGIRVRMPMSVDNKRNVVVWGRIAGTPEARRSVDDDKNDPGLEDLWEHEIGHALITNEIVAMFARGPAAHFGTTGEVYSIGPIPRRGGVPAVQAALERIVGNARALVGYFSTVTDGLYETITQAVDGGAAGGIVSIGPDDRGVIHWPVGQAVSVRQMIVQSGRLLATMDDETRLTERGLAIRRNALDIFRVEGAAYSIRLQRVTGRALAYVTWEYGHLHADRYMVIPPDFMDLGAHPPGGYGVGRRDFSRGMRPLEELSQIWASW